MYGAGVSPPLPALSRSRRAFASPSALSPREGLRRPRPERSGVSRVRPEHRSSGVDRGQRPKACGTGGGAVTQYNGATGRVVTNTPTEFHQSCCFLRSRRLMEWTTGANQRQSGDAGPALLPGDRRPQPPRRPLSHAAHPSAARRSPGLGHGVSVRAPGQSREGMGRGRGGGGGLRSGKHRDGWTGARPCGTQRPRCTRSKTVINCSSPLLNHARFNVSGGGGDISAALRAALRAAGT
ncbi:hypothetical protein AAFF_G00309550 [Aldrovandia affinis]|uniref:Uncharacterized protein n=1 Tax=Aldrovandia affinis TaxID=143900 RepID=A0AAD7SNQ6_9TELE|nr:hypothetical protein AAFF_G00309550 [Aldrovandia affinis]